MIYCTAIDDAKVLAELYQEWVGHTPQFKGIQINSLWVAARDGDKYVGAAQLIIIDDPIWDRRWGLVENVYVAEAYRRRGIGKELMSTIESTAYGGFDCEFVKLTSASEKFMGHSLYRSMKYKEGLSFKRLLK